MARKGGAQCFSDTTFFGLWAIFHVLAKLDVLGWKKVVIFVAFAIKQPFLAVL